METVLITDKEGLDALYKDSAFTIEGLAANAENLKELADWVKRHTPFKTERAYVASGALMNRVYGLTGTNAYPEDDCTLVAIKLSDLEKPLALAVPRFEIGGRWFDDIVDNNRWREEEKRGR
ncbi:MAG: hypothetical protein K6F50_06310 [Kiritimatiellae bacterium]|nr:hypothetical protein [Kiritimatiellia bacterium]